MTASAKPTASSRPDNSPAQARARSATYRARKIHRWLGLIIGIQFVLWTIGGLYFSWTDLDDVHGDHLIRPAPRIAPDVRVVSPSDVVLSLRERQSVDSVLSAELVNVLGQPTWRVAYLSDGQRRTQLADARAGTLRAPLDSAAAVATARAAYTGQGPITAVEYLTAEQVGKHHEYREMPLPAWAVRFGDAESATAYVAAELGHVVRIRNDKWRAFDFLWMLHTMDYQGRDNFNNLALGAPAGTAARGWRVVGGGGLSAGVVRREPRARRGSAPPPAGGRAARRDAGRCAGRAGRG